jgi:hypothetical protein
MTDVISDDDVDRAIGVFNDLTVVRLGAELSEIGRLVHNDNLYDAMVGVTEATMIDHTAEGYVKITDTKMKAKARSSKEYIAAIKKAAVAKGMLAQARMSVEAAKNVIEIWRSQQANNRKGHL